MSAYFSDVKRSGTPTLPATVAANISAMSAQAQADQQLADLKAQQDAAAALAATARATEQALFGTDATGATPPPADSGVPVVPLVLGGVALLGVVGVIIYKRRKRSAASVSGWRRRNAKRNKRRKRVRR